MSERADCVVVGSGMSGVHAALTLTENGRNVLMLDVGIDEAKYRGLVPDADFVSTRKEGRNQARYFLGDEFEGIPWGPAQHTLTPPRQFITQDVERWLRRSVDGFHSMESLAYGGLGNAWGAGCAAYAEPELEALGGDAAAMTRAYQVVADRIGVCAAPDDIAPFSCNGMHGCLPPMELDSCMEAVYETYQRKRRSLNRKGVFVGQPPLAVLTRDRPGRRATRYQDMEFWTDHGNAVYRPRVSLEKLRGLRSFTYRDSHLVTRFVEEQDGVTVEAIHTGTNEKLQVRCGVLVLSTGTLGTARIVLRSVPGAARLPILTNQYSLAPCIQWRRLGAAQDSRKTSVGQLVLYYDEDGRGYGMSMVSMYTYRSLLLFKLAKELPLDLGSAREIMRRLSSSLIIASLNHPDEPAPEKYLEREEDSGSPTGDRLVVHYEPSLQEKRGHERTERRLVRALRRLGVYTLKRERLPPGSSVHYVGCLPFSQEEKAHHLLPDGRLSGTRHVYVADGSGFRYLPANGPTLSIMAHAHLVAEAIGRKG